MWNSLKKEPFLYIAQCRHCMKLMQERHGGKGKRCWTFTNNHISSTPNTKKAQIRLASTSLNKFFTQLYKTFTRVVFIVTSDNPGWARNHLGGRWLLNEQDKESVTDLEKRIWVASEAFLGLILFSSGTTHIFPAVLLQHLLMGQQLWG